MRRVLRFGSYLALVVSLLGPARVGATDALSWDARQQVFSAQFQSARLNSVLTRVASATGWKVYVEPGATNRVSTEFKELSVGEALRLLLGDLNFALIPQTNRSTKLLVFRSGAQNATALISSGDSNAIPNELVVRLRPGIDVNALANALRAKVKGRLAGLNAYRLQFENAQAAEAARDALADNPDIASVEDNYGIKRQPNSQPNLNPSADAISLQLKPPPAGGRLIVGLVDTAVQPLGENLDQFILPSIRVAGDPQPQGDMPSHGTSMAETLLRSLEAATKGETFFQILPGGVYSPA